MGDFTIGTKSVLSQSGSDEAVLSGDVNLASATFPAGHVIQTVHSSSSAYGSTTAQSYEAGHNQAITPLKVTSLILVRITANLLLNRAAAERPIGNVAIYKGSISTILREAQIRATTATTNQGLYDLVHIDYLDDPDTTSPTTYGIALKTEAANTSFYFDDGGPTTITLQEIAQ